MYDLFNDIEDHTIRNYNRGVTMANIFEDHPAEGGVSASGMAELINYFKQISDVEKGAVIECFRVTMESRGFSAPVLKPTVH